MQIPIIEITPKGELAQPTTNGIDWYLQNRIDQSSEAIIQLSQEHRIIDLPPTSPHTQGFHTVYWLDKENSNTVGAWDSDSINSFFGDPEFWNNMQNFFTEKLQGNSRYKIYSYIGFTPKMEPASNVLPYNLQSQPRPHFHLSEELDLTDIVGHLSSENPGHRTRLATILDTGNTYLNDLIDLDGFGRRFSFTQSVGNEGYSINRTVFGFDSLKDAFADTLLLQKASMTFWSNVKASLGDHELRVNGGTYPVLQTPGPNFVIVMPDEKSRSFADQNGKDSAVWVIPYTTAGALNLVQGGVSIQRAIPK